MAEKMREATDADVWTRMLEQLEVLHMVADTSGNLRGMHVKALRQVAEVFANGIRELSRRKDTRPGVTAIVEARLEALEAERAVPPAWAQSRLTAIERKMDELSAALARLTEEHSEIEGRKKGKEFVPDETACRMNTGAPKAPTNTAGQADATEWQTVERRRGKSRKASAGQQPAKTLLRPCSKKNPSKVLERRTGTAGEKGGKPPLPRPQRTSAITITVKEGANQTYAEVLAAARGSIPLDGVGVGSLNMRKAMTGGFVLELPGDRNREKATALATQLTRILDPNKVRVATPFRTAEAMVIGMDVSVTKEEIRNTLAAEGGCKAEDVQLGEVRSARNGLGSSWMRGPAGAVRRLAQAGKARIGWSTAKIEDLARRPLQCYKCLEFGHVRGTCTSAEERGHLCYRCGGSGHRARGCTTASPKCLLCEAHRMGGPICAPPRKERRTTREPTATGRDKESSPPQGASKEAGAVDAMEAMTVGD
jgi:hypothetical protein